ncbi:oligosaccharide flippase family protein [Vibrio vulnificus]|nr:oligosaccharide flippase family protein [Vibrio vulnificus]
MSLKKNVVANYISQVYATAIGILILPLYIKYIGVEAYGLVGFFTMLQAWFTLLDLGLTPTIARETARYHGGSMDALKFRQILRSLSVIFVAIAFVGGSFLWLFSEVIAKKWLNFDTLPIDVVSFSVEVMAFCIALRWLCGLFRGVITGSEKLVWLSSFNIVIANLRFLGVFVSMGIFGYTPSVFFMHQLCIALFELFGYWSMSLRLIPSKKLIAGKIGWSFKPVKLILKFSLSIAFTSSIWVMVTQSDKLVLSGILPLTEYGYFTLAVLLSSGIMMVSGPISTALMPRMARLYAEGKNEEMIRLYRRATQMVTIVAGSAAIVIACSAEPLLRIWTGEDSIALGAAPILKLYAIGYGFLAISAFPYYLQYAMGNLRYHLIGSFTMVLLLVPAIIFSANKYGSFGAGVVWLSVNLFYLLFWCSFIHKKLQENITSTWIFKDVLIILLPSAIFSFVLTTKGYLFSYFNEMFGIFILSVFSIFISSIFSSEIMGVIKSRVKISKI